MQPSPVAARHTPHVRIPSALQFDEDLPRGARDLWAVLDDLAREHAGVLATGPVLCAALAASPASLRRWRAALVEAGWLRHEGAQGRGVPSLWVPLRRARTVRSQTPLDLSAPPVDNPQKPAHQRAFNGAETRSQQSAFDQGNPLTDERLSPRASSTARAREEEEAPTASRGALATLIAPGATTTTATRSRWSHTTPWCGQCDDADYRWTESLAEPGRVVRCPACHPAAEPAF